MRLAVAGLLAALLCAGTSVAQVRNDPVFNSVNLGPSGNQQPIQRSPFSYGAICNGSSNPISSTALPHTVAGLAAYTTANGATPYAWLTNGNWAFHVAMPVLGGATSGATNLTVYSVAGLAAGMIVTGTNIPSNDTIASVHVASGSSLAYITLTTAITGNIPAYQISTTNTPYIEIVQASGTAPTDAQIAAAEVDWLATQAAIQAVSTASGGQVIMPPTQCMMSNSSSPGTMMGTLQLPAGSDVSWSGVGIVLDSIGTGVDAVLYYPTDLGAGRIGISNDVPWADPANQLGRYGYNFYYGNINNIQVLGPGSNFTLGNAPTVFMTGYGQGARRKLDKVAIRGFYNGVSFVGDHTPWRDVEINNNQNYGVYWDYVNSSLANDNDCFACLISGNGLAGIGVSYATQLTWHMYSGYMGDNPYAIYGEGTPSGASSIGLIQGFYAANMNWEWNAGQIYDSTGDTYTYSNGAVASVTVGTKGRSLTTSIFDNVYFSLSGYGGPNSSIPNRPVTYTVYVGNIDGVRFINGSDFSAGGTHGDFGSAGLFNATTIGAVSGGLYMQGDISTLIADLNANTLYFLANGTNGVFNTTFEQSGMFMARLYQAQPGYCTGGTPTVGQIVEMATGSSPCYEAMAPAGTATAAAVMGYMATGGTAGPSIVITQSHSLSVGATGSFNAGVYLKKSTTAGDVTAVAGTAGEVPIGRATLAPSGGTVQMELLPQ